MSFETDLHFRLEDKEGEPLSRMPNWSARGCTQTLTLLSQVDLRRTVNGELIDVSSPSHRKYRSTISCRDKFPLAFDGVWIGSALWVDCIQQLVTPFAEAQEKIILSRKPVPNSVTAKEEDGKSLLIKEVQETAVILDVSPSKPGFITYHPQLLMRLTDYSLETDEWGMVSGWTLTLEEV